MIKIRRITASTANPYSAPLLACFVVVIVLFLFVYHRCDDTDDREEERQHFVPDASGIVNRSFQEFIFCLGKMNLVVLPFYFLARLFGW